MEQFLEIPHSSHHHGEFKVGAYLEIFLGTLLNAAV
jgi:hypothetical protein